MQRVRKIRNIKRERKPITFKLFLFSLLTPISWVSKNLPLIAAMVLIVSVVSSAALYFYYYSYVPGEEQFKECKSIFVKVKEKPTYGILMDIDKVKVEQIHILGVGQTGLPVSINIKADNWVTVYFSDKFPYSQVSELLRLSKLETGTINYCWIAEQVSLLTGVPLEYMVVRENSIPIVSNIRMYEFMQIYNQFSHGTQKDIDLKYGVVQKLEDDSKVSVITFNSIKTQLPNLFKIQEVTNEQAFVEVYNSSEIAGYASLVAHKLTMLGIEVSRIGNTNATDEIDVDAIIYTKDRTQYARTIELVISTLPAGGKVIVRDGRPPNLVTTGDIVVILLKR